MRECPKCGYVDPPAWRHRLSHGQNEDVCNWDDFQLLSPEIAEKIKGGMARASDGRYAYRLVKTAFARRYGGALVVRQWLPEYKAKAPKREKPSHRLIANHPTTLDTLIKTVKTESRQITV